MHRFIILVTMLAVTALVDCASNTDRADDLYRAHLSDRHNPAPSAGW